MPHGLWKSGRYHTTATHCRQLRVAFKNYLNRCKRGRKYNSAFNCPPKGCSILGKVRRTGPPRPQNGGTWGSDIATRTASSSRRYFLAPPPTAVLTLERGSPGPGVGRLHRAVQRRNRSGHRVL